MTRDELRHQGERMRERLGQPSSLPGALGRDGTAPGFAQMMSEAVYGGVWSRPGLPLAERMICALAVTGLRAPSPEHAALMDSALDLGLAARSILEVFVQCGLYGGFGTTQAACAQAHEVFAARGVTVPDEPLREDSVERLDEGGRALMHALHGARATSTPSRSATVTGSSGHAPGWTAASACSVRWRHSRRWAWRASS